MKQNVMLTIASLLSILFMTFHLTDDIVRGMEPGTLSTLVALPILAVWLYGTVALAGKRSGYVIILLGSLLGLVVPVVHMKGAGVGGAMAKSSGAFFFIWILLALGVTALFSIILSARTVGAFALACRRAAQRRCPCMKQRRLTVRSSGLTVH
jgi:hypothetical protein